MVEAITPSVVVVGTHAPLRQPRGDFHGTGFAVGAGNHVITNAHVLPEQLDDANGERLVIFVRERGRVQHRSVSVVAEHPEHDLALLRLHGEPLRGLELGDSSRVRVGERYAFTGFPIGTVLGFHPVTHEALISAITPIAIPQRKAGELDTTFIHRLRRAYDVFQLDGTAYPGNSGSPLYDRDTGVVVGVVNKVFVKETKEAVLRDPSGIAYAVPSRYARELMETAGVR